MNLASIILLTAIAVLAVIALYVIHKNKNKGACSGCGGYCMDCELCRNNSKAE